MAQISVIQIFRKDSFTENSKYIKIVRENAEFLEQFQVEYLVYDNLQSYEILNFIKDIPYCKYYKSKFENLKKSFTESFQLGSGVKIIFLKSDDILNMENVELLENKRPYMYKKDFPKLITLKYENFKYDDFNLLIKDKKTIIDEVKIILSHYFL